MAGNIQNKRNFFWVAKHNFFIFEKSWNFFILNNAHTKYKHILFNENFCKEAASRDIEQKCVFQRGSFWIFSQYITVVEREKGCFCSFKDPLHYFECIKTPKSRKKEKKWAQNSTIQTMAGFHFECLQFLHFSWEWNQLKRKLLQITSCKWW